MATKKKMLQAAAGFGGNVGAWDLSYAYYDDPLFWDVSSAVYLRNFSIAGQETTPEGLFFKPDGTKMYVIGRVGDDVNEYNLSTAWNISSASYLQNFSVLAQEAFPKDIFFKPDGTKMYVVGGQGKDINEYNLSTAWDISTAVFLQLFYVANEVSSPEAVFFKPDGSKMYVADLSLNNVAEYNLSTAWDVSTAVYLQLFYIGSQESAVRGLSFKSDGTKMYITGSTGDEVNEYALSTAWDVSTASFIQLFSVSAQDTQPSGLYIKPDGSSLYIVGETNDTVYQYTLGGFSVAAQDTTPFNMTFKTDGTKMYFVGSTNDSVYEYNLSTAWDISSASFLQSLSVAAQETSPYGLFFKPDGTKMYVLGDSGNGVDEYDLSTAWDISSASFLQYFSVGTQDLRPYGVFFKSDGNKMYVVGINSDSVHEYNLSTAWDISTASFLQTFSLTAQITNAAGLFFREDGLKMYVVDVTSLDVNEYDLSTAWDVSTASYLQNFSVSGQENGSVGVFFKPTGDKMFILGYGRSKVFTYSLGVQE